MKRTTQSAGIILFFLILLVSMTSSVKADEMFFVTFYVVDSKGTPLNGVEIVVTGIYGYDETTYTESNGYSPRLDLLSDQRNAVYDWTATYQNSSENGDFSVPKNYNQVNIVMTEIPMPTLAPTPTISSTPTVAPSNTQSPTATSSPTPSSIPTNTPTATLTPTPINPTSTPTTTASSTIQPSTTSTPENSPTPTDIPEFTTLVVLPLLAVILCAVFLSRAKLFKKQK
jgi:hypothetical protein